MHAAHLFEPQTLALVVQLLGHLRVALGLHLRSFAIDLGRRQLLAVLVESRRRLGRAREPLELLRMQVEVSWDQAEQMLKRSVVAEQRFLRASVPISSVGVPRAFRSRVSARCLASSAGSTTAAGALDGADADAALDDDESESLSTTGGDTSTCLRLPIATCASRPSRIF